MNDLPDPRQRYTGIDDSPSAARQAIHRDTTSEAITGDSAHRLHTRTSAPVLVDVRQSAGLLSASLTARWPQTCFTVSPGRGRHSALQLLRAAQSEESGTVCARGTASGAHRDAVRWDDGPALNIGWVDGPRPCEVEAVADLFLGLEYDPASERIYLRESLLARPQAGTLPRLVRFDVTAVRTEHRFSQQYRTDLLSCIGVLQHATSASCEPQHDRVALQTPWGPFIGTQAHLVTYLAAFLTPVQARQAAGMDPTDALAFLRWLA